MKETMVLLIALALLCQALPCLGEGDAPEVQTGEIGDSWDEIIAAIDDDTAQQRYAVGQTKELDLGELGTVHMQLAGFDVDERADGKGMAATTWIAVELLPELYAMNEDNTNEGGWRDSDLRAYMNDTVYQAIEEVVRERLVRVRKTQREDWKGTVIQTTEDLVWIPDEVEVWGLDSPYFGLFGGREENCVKEKDGSPFPWWTRSVATKSFFGVSKTGRFVNVKPDLPLGVAVCFCL